MKFRQIFLVIATSFISSVGTVVFYNSLNNKKGVLFTSAQGNIAARDVKFAEGDYGLPSDPIDFTKAARVSTPAVVRIKTKIPAKKIADNHPDVENFLNQFFGPELGPNISPEERASGSGVIISIDGYIVTNNHVISDENSVAAEISVTLYNGKTYKAKLIGRNAGTDIAVLKIDDTNLPYLNCANSDDVQTGQWVLAVGYPLSLEATVTAGIVSATGRTMNASNREARNGETVFRSFIQTDAAVNRGSSGGALVDINGKLIGINSAIVSPTGTYAGYSFAIPINAVQRSVRDIVQLSKPRKDFR